MMTLVFVLIWVAFIASSNKSIGKSSVVLIIGLPYLLCIKISHCVYGINFYIPNGRGNLPQTFSTCAVTR